jgi:hypothetical protein
MARAQNPIRHFIFDNAVTQRFLQDILLEVLVKVTRAAAEVAIWSACLGISRRTQRSKWADQLKLLK